jgi:hypothetical protein
MINYVNISFFGIRHRLHFVKDILIDLKTCLSAAVLCTVNSKLRAGGCSRALFQRTVPGSTEEYYEVKSKAVPLHAMEAHGGRGGVVNTHT